MLGEPSDEQLPSSIAVTIRDAFAEQGDPAWRNGVLSEVVALLPTWSSARSIRIHGRPEGEFYSLSTKGTVEAANEGEATADRALANVGAR